jgi:predicted ArsR family transcriptional regulator
VNEPDLKGLAAFVDPIRRDLYRYVIARAMPVGREEAAKVVGISRSLAAYHLDRLVDEGLLETRYERPEGRRGPGAGRPAKLYSRGSRQLEVTIPKRDYALVGEVLARAMEEPESRPARTAVTRVAASAGAELAAQLRGHRHGPQQATAAVRALLEERGYEPYDDPEGGLRLRNCPFESLAATHRELVCGMNLVLLQALAEAAGGVGDLSVVLEPQPGECCVAFRRR